MKSLKTLLFALFFISNCYAAIVVEKLDATKKIATVKVVGKIEYGEEQELERELEALNSDGYLLKMNSIQLNTRGGNRFSAMAMGRMIRDRKLNTFVAKDSVCGSACIFVVSGGLVRMVYGKVTVHRTSIAESIQIVSVEKFIKQGDAEITDYLKEMGLSLLVTDAILMTPNWATREITEIELRRWGVNATDRLYEETWFRRTAAQKNRSVEEVKDAFDQHISSCVKMPQGFVMTLWDCIYAKIPSKK